MNTLPILQNGDIQIPWRLNTLCLTHDCDEKAKKVQKRCWLDYLRIWKIFLSNLGMLHHDASYQQRVLHEEHWTVLFENSDHSLRNRTIFPLLMHCFSFKAF